MLSRAFGRYARQFRATGLPRPLLLAAAAGGDPPLPEEAQWHLLPEDHLPKAPLGERLKVEQPWQSDTAHPAVWEGQRLTSSR